MARLRTLKPGFFANDELAEIEPLGRLLFAGLWTIADREGRLEDRPKRIKAEVLPYDDSDVDGLLDSLAARGFIVRYAVAGARYIQVANFGKHQNPHKNEAPSMIPAPEGHHTSTVQAVDMPTTSHAEYLESEYLGEEYGSGEGGAGGGGADAPTAPDPLPLDDAPEPVPKQAAVKTGKRPVPTDFKPTSDLLGWAAENVPEVDIGTETAKFVDHFRASGDRKSDWSAAWRNWMRRAPEFRMVPNGRRPTQADHNSARRGKVVV